jgi:hypothetical protein
MTGNAGKLYSPIGSMPFAGYPLARGLLAIEA